MVDISIRAFGMVDISTRAFGRVDISSRANLGSLGSRIVAIKKGLQHCGRMESGHAEI